MLESNLKIAGKNNVIQSTLSINASGDFPSGGIDIKGYNNLFFYVSGTFNGSVIVAKLKNQGTTILSAAPKIFDLINGQEVLNITAAGYYVISVKGYDLLYLTASNYGGNVLTVNYNYSLADLIQISRTEAYYEKQFTAFNSFTSASGYSSKIIINGGVNTAIVYIQITGGTATIVGERRTSDSTSWINDQAGQIYNSKFEPVDNITVTGLYFIDIRGAEVFYLYCTTNSGATINARIKTSLMQLPVNHDIIRKTIFNAVTSAGYSSAITKSLKHRFIKLDVRGTYDGVFELIGRYSDSTDKKITMYNQKGLALTEVKGEGIYYADISLWTTIYGLLIYQTTGTLTVYAEFLENAAFATVPQAGNNLFEKYELFATCSMTYPNKYFNIYYDSFTVRNKSKYAAIEIYFYNSIDQTATNPIRVLPGERVNIKVSNKNVVYYRAVVGTAEFSIIGGDISLSPVPPVQNNITVDLVTGNIPLDVKGNWIVSQDSTNKNTLYFSIDSGRNTYKTYNFDSGEVIDYAYIYYISSLSEIDILVHGITGGWYKIKNAFTSGTISVTGIDTLNNPPSFNGIYQPVAVHSYSNGYYSIDTAPGGLTMLFGEYVSTLYGNDNNMRLFRSLDGGDTWSVLKSFARGWRDSSNGGFHFKIDSVDVDNKQLNVTGDATLWAYNGQSCYIIDSTYGQILTMTNIFYNSGTVKSIITIAEIPDLNWANLYINGPRHFHVVRYNHYDKQFYICTGDNDNECVFMTMPLDLSSLNLIKQSGGSQTWRTITLSFDGEGYVYWACDGKTNAGGVNRAKIGTWTIENLFYLHSETYVFIFESGVMLVGTESNGSSISPSNAHEMNITPELYASYDKGKSWQKVFEWKPSNGYVGGFYAQLGRDGESYYYIFGGGLLGIGTQASGFTSGLKIKF